MDVNHKGPETGEVTKEYRAGLRGFFQQATNQPFAREHGKIFCPCRKCKNEPYLEIDTVKRHLYNRGFRPNYYIWFLHGEGASSSSTGQGFELPNYNADYVPREPNMLEIMRVMGMSKICLKIMRGIGMSNMEIDITIWLQMHCMKLLLLIVVGKNLT